MTSAQAAKKHGITVSALIRNGKSKGVLPKRVIKTGKRGRPGYDWTEQQAAQAAGA